MLPTTLYHIRQEHLDLLSQLEEQDGELTPDLEQALSLTQEAFQDKAISYGFITKAFDAGTDMIEAEIKRLKDLQQKSVKRAELFKTRLSEAMQQFGVEKIETPTLKLSFRKSEAVEVLDEKLLPQSVLEEVPATWKVSKTKIKEALKAGTAVPGAELVTRQNLQIK